MVTHRLQCVYLPVSRANAPRARKIPLNLLERYPFVRFGFPASPLVSGLFAFFCKSNFPFNITKSRCGSVGPGCDFLFLAMRRFSENKPCLPSDLTTKHASCQG